MGPGPLVGAHVSIAGGLSRAVERGAGISCRTIQIFTRSSSQWGGKPVAAEDAASFRAAAEDARLAPVVSHCSYLINLASSDAATRERSVAALTDEIRRCDLLAIPWLVLHPGSHGGDGEEAGIDRIARGLDRAMAGVEGSRTLVLLETAAGQGSCLGHTFQQLKAIRGRTGAKDRIAFCLDTCHVHAAGYDLLTHDGWRKTLEELDRLLGLPLVRVIHANDSKRERGSRVDRHERIGLGAMGEAPFRFLMREPAFEGVPKILETPKDEKGEWDRAGLAALRRLARRGAGARKTGREAT